MCAGNNEYVAGGEELLYMAGLLVVETGTPTRPANLYTYSVQLMNNCSERGPSLCQRKRVAYSGGILFPAVSQRIGLRNLKEWLMIS